jgi:hypothetical protein
MDEIIFTEMAELMYKILEVGKVDAADIDKAHTVALLHSDAPEWVDVVANAHPFDADFEAVADEAAKWLCVGWLEENHPELLREVDDGSGN